LICSEDVLGRSVREAADQGAQGFIVLLNDGWFSRPEALRLHAANMVMHSVENQRPAVRVANTGWTIKIDRYGRITQNSALPFQEKGAALLQMALHPEEKARHRILGDWFCLVCGMFVIIIRLGRFLRPRM